MVECNNDPQVCKLWNILILETQLVFSLPGYSINLYFRIRVIFFDFPPRPPAAFIEVGCILKLSEGSSIDTNHTCNKSELEPKKQMLKHLTTHNLLRWTIRTGYLM